MKCLNYKMVFLGDTAVGKTSISHRYINDDFYEFQEPTIGAAFLSKSFDVDNNKIKLDMWDTAGQERYRSLTPMYYRGADFAMIVYDITMARSFEGACSWINEINTKTTNCKVILLGNKCDLKDRRVDSETVENYCNENDITHFLVSAKTGENIKKAFEYLINNLPEKNNLTTNPISIYKIETKTKNRCC